MKVLPMNLIWFATVGAFVLMAVSLWLLREASTPILTAGIPSLLALCGIDRWAARQAGSEP